eukprot:gene13697-16187_t
MRAQLREALIFSAAANVKKLAEDCHGPFLAHAIISNPVTYGHIHCAQIVVRGGADEGAQLKGGVRCKQCPVEELTVGCLAGAFLDLLRQDRILRNTASLAAVMERE